MEKKNWERFRWSSTWKIDFESQIEALFDTNSQSSINSFGYICSFLSIFFSFFVPPRLKTRQPILPYLYVIFSLFASAKQTNPTTNLPRVNSKVFWARLKQKISRRFQKGPRPVYCLHSIVADELRWHWVPSTFFAVSEHNKSNIQRNQIKITLHNGREGRN